LNLALRDVYTLAQILSEAVAAAEMPGSMRILQRYVQAQQSDQNLSINFTDYATRLFSSNNSAKVIARKIGLLAIDLVPGLRQEFAQQAMGLTCSRQEKYSFHGPNMRPVGMSHTQQFGYSEFASI